MASRRVGLALPEWPETKEERLEREKEEAELRLAQKALAEQVQKSKSTPLDDEMFKLLTTRNKKQ
jgi:hypothetical protein